VINGHNFAPLLRRLRCVAGFLFIGTLVHQENACAQQSFGSFEFDKATSTRLEIESVFDPPPPTGFLPVRVLVANGLPQANSWALDFSSRRGGYGGNDSTIDSRFTVAAGPGETITFRLLVPLATNYQTSSGGDNITVKVSGTAGATRQGQVPGQSTDDCPAIAISKRLAEKSLTALDDALGKSKGRSYGNGGFASRFDPEMLPEEWLGYSGFDVVMITGDEWLKVTPGARAALLQWTRFGGRLHLYTSNSSAILSNFGLPSATPRHLERTLGEIEIRPWNDDALDAPATVSLYAGLPYRMAALREQFHHSSNWPLLTALGERSFAGWQVIVFLFVFGILVGPVNLFVLAPSGRRHRLFFTTPAISLGASLLLIVVILFQDGMGGAGRRFIAIELRPEESSAFVTQEQVSRTGVLLSSAFALSPATLVQQVRGSVHGSRWSGTWFQSRTEQGQMLQTIVPTRGRIELVPPAAPEAAPVIVSSLDIKLDSLGYRDADGRLWQAPAAVEKGIKISLVPAESRSMAIGSTDGCGLAHDHLRKSLVTRLEQNSSFVGLSRSAPGFSIDTLPSIRWSDDRVFVFGPVTPAAP
jgi:hypothetical protein